MGIWKSFRTWWAKTALIERTLCLGKDCVKIYVGLPWQIDMICQKYTDWLDDDGCPIFPQSVFNSQEPQFHGIFFVKDKQPTIYCRDDWDTLLHELQHWLDYLLLEKKQ